MIGSRLSGVGAERGCARWGRWFAAHGPVEQRRQRSQRAWAARARPATTHAAARGNRTAACNNRTWPTARGRPCRGRRPGRVQHGRCGDGRARLTLYSDSSPSPSPSLQTSPSRHAAPSASTGKPAARGRSSAWQTGSATRLDGCEERWTWCGGDACCSTWRITQC